MTQSPPNTDSEKTITSKLTWQLLLSVILIYMLGLIRQVAMLVYTIVMIVASILLMNIERIELGGLLESIFYILLVIGLTNRKKVFRFVSIIQSVFSLLFNGFISIIGILDHSAWMKFSIHQLIPLDLNHSGIAILFGIFTLVQVYKIYVLLRKDVRTLFSDKPQPQASPSTSKGLSG